MVVNLNDTCEVTLTEAGAKQYNTQRDKLYRMMRKPCPDPVSTGYVYRTQLWALFHDFGPALHLGSRVPFDLCEIRFTENQ